MPRQTTIAFGVIGVMLILVSFFIPVVFFLSLLAFLLVIINIVSHIYKIDEACKKDDYFQVRGKKIFIFSSISLGALFIIGLKIINNIDSLNKTTRPRNSKQHVNVITLNHVMMLLLDIRLWVK